MGRAIPVLLAALVMGCAAHWHHPVTQASEAELPEAESPGGLGAGATDGVAIRLVGPHGPVVRRRWIAEVEDIGRDHVAVLGRGVTDDEGRLTFKPWTGCVHIQVLEGRDGQAVLEGTLVFENCESRPALTNLGKLRVAEASVFAGGIVQTPTGQPVAGATVTVGRWVRGCCAHLPWEQERFVGAVWVNTGRIERLRAVSDRSGRFTIRGSTAVDLLSIETANSGYVQLIPEDLFVRKGDRNVRVVMAPRASNPENAIPDAPPAPAPPVR